MRPSRSLVQVLAPIALGVLVVALGALQYRWLGQVSEAEGRELRASLDRRVREFTDDADRELTALQTVVREAAVYDDLAASLSLKLSAWNSTARFPGLVTTAYETREEHGQFTLRRLDVSKHTLDPVDWPRPLQPVRERLLPTQVTTSASAERGTTQFMTRSSSSVVAAVPALIVWLPERVAFEPGPRARQATPMPAFDMPSPGRAVILTLSLDVITRTVLPALLDQHFGSDRFRAAVRDQHGTTLASLGLPAGQPLTATSADRTTTFLSIGPGEIVADRMLMFSIGGPTGTPAARGDARFAVRVERQDVTGDVRSTPPVDARDRWTLLVQHQAGSLDLAVAQARRRNLFLSFGILSVLVLAIGLVLGAAQRSERLARQQMEFVATVSHELRTPLAVIRSAGENLAAGVVFDPTQTKRYGDLIEAEGRRLTDMVEQVLAHAGVHAARRPLAMGAVDVNHLVSECAQACAPVAERSGCVIETSLAADTPAARADEPLLRRVLENLIVNAVKHGGSGRWIGVSARPFETVDGGAAEIAVADRGPGIAPEDRSHIFEPFYRGRAAIEGQVPGSGLGLSLVTQALDGMNATIEVVDRPGGGVEFRIRLPAADDAPESRAEEAAG